MAVEPVRITIRIPPELHEAITRQAKTDGTSINQQIVNRLYAGLEMTPAPEAPEDLGRIIAEVLIGEGVSLEALKQLSNAMEENPGRALVSSGEIDEIVDKRLFHHGIARLREEKQEDHEVGNG